jgi:hypothetical protein
MAIFSITSIRDVAFLVGLGAGIYAAFFLLGFGFSTAVSFEECGKIDTQKNATQGAIWAMYPTVAWFIIRSFEILRVQFDRFYRSIDSSEGGVERAGWISIGYVLMLAAIVGVYTLVSNTKKEVCIPDVDEMTKFKNDMLLKIKEKKDNLAAAQETTPAVTPVTDSARSGKKQPPT